MTEEKVEEKQEEVQTEIEEKSEEGSSVETEQDGKVEVLDVTKVERDACLKSMQNMIFKVDKFFFKVTYVNLGQGRFTATALNDLKK